MPEPAPLTRAVARDSLAAGRIAQRSLRERTLVGASWSLGGTALGQLLRFAGNLALTRLLFEEAFGLMLIVNSVLLGLRMLSDVGISASIVQSRRADDSRFLDTAWTLQILRGAALWLIVLLAASPLARFYARPELASLLPVAGLCLLLDGWASTSLSTLRRELRLRALVLLEIAVQATALLVMLAWAWARPSVWALVAGALAGSLVRVTASHTLLATRRCSLAWQRESVAAMLSFGSWTLLNTALGFAADQADRFVLGKLVALHVLGVYSVAVLVANLPYLILGQLGGSVVFPALARARNEGRDLLSAYDRIRTNVLVAGGWLVACLAASGPLAIAVLWDARWQQAAAMILPLAAGQWLRILYLPSANALFALGRLRWLAGANAIKLVGYAALVPVGFQLGGLLGALYGFAAGEALGYATYAVGMFRQGASRLAGDLGYTALAGAAAAAGLLSARLAVDAGAPAPLALLAAALTPSLVWIRPALPLLAELRARR